MLAAGLVLHPAVRNDGLGELLIATGSDGYQITFSIGELDPTFGNQPDFVAYLADGLPLGQNGSRAIAEPSTAALA